MLLNCGAVVQQYVVRTLTAFSFNECFCGHAASTGQNRTRAPGGGFHKQRNTATKSLFAIVSVVATRGATRYDKAILTSFPLL